MKKFMIAAVSALTLSLTLAACSPSSAPSNEPAVQPSSSAVIIDVRTPEEHVTGHLEGAQLLDLNGGEFAANFKSLDPAGEYYVYCRSGNRSGQAVSMMEAEGFTNVTNLGSVQEASKATGIAIVK